MEIKAYACLIQPLDRQYKDHNENRQEHIEYRDDGLSYALRTNGQAMVVICN